MDNVPEGRGFYQQYAHNLNLRKVLLPTRIMHLKSIKLIGFKSFVDATHIEFDNNINAVVGPNGCGKSNIIDAVRWVLGESSAQSMRTKQMASVIFAGSDKRAAYSKASVELVFDNSSKRIGGEYASFQELSIKRSINSEGVSTYGLNGSTCRRRDIQDLFYGVGIVGSGSYAIIEQGTINRFTEARPEELREILEEAAGTSRYKERRRETLRRLESTSENLERVSDNLQQLEAQIVSLSEQSQQARHFRDLQSRITRLEGEINFLRFEQLDQQIDQEQQQLEQAQQRLQANRQQFDIESAQLSTAEAALDSQQREYNQVNQQQVQLAREVAEKRSEVNSARTQLEAFSNDSEKLQQARGQVESLLTQDQLQIEQHQSDISARQPQQQSLEAELAQAVNNLAQASAELERAQDDWQSWQQQRSKLQSAAEIARNKLDSLAARGQELEQRRVKLAAASTSVDSSADTEQQAALQQELSQQQQQLEDLDQQRAAAERAQQELQQQVQSQKSTVRAGDEQERQLNQELAAARALIQHLERKQPELVRWMQAHGIDPDIGIDQDMLIASGWERALETALGVFLQARSSAQLPQILSEHKSPPAPIALLEASTSAPAPSGSLASCVLRGSYPAFLASIEIAEDVAEALAKRAQLRDGHSVITRSGLWLGSNWALLSPQADNSLIEQRRKYSEAEQRLQQVQEQNQQLKQQLRAIQQQHEQRAAETQQQRQQRQNLQLTHERSRHQLQRLQDKLSNQQRQRQAYATELHSVEQQIEQLAEQQSQQREHWSQSLEQLEHIAGGEQQQQNLNELRARYQQALERERELRQQDNQNKISIREAQVQLSSLQSNIQRSEQQLATNAAQSEQLQSQISTLTARIPELEERFQSAVQAQAALEESVRAINAELGANKDAVAQLGKTCNNLRLQEQKIISARTRHEQQQQNLIEQKQELQAQHPDIDLEAIGAQLDRSTSSKARQKILQSLREQLEALGAVNLLAEVQHSEAVTKQDEVAKQVAELNEARLSLESAIQKIDSESRSVLKQTLESVNANLKREFARIFAGGQAQLSAQPGDLLESGLILFAQPAGKKVTQISALSGGEKALTALALVFAIFELNPAPFCLLDEVDAPLDENNTNRFANLIREFSRHSQFILVTHNRISMEIADKLVGITMNEPGVSRNVSVNLSELAS